MGSFIALWAAPVVELDVLVLLEQEVLILLELEVLEVLELLVLEVLELLVLEVLELEMLEVVELLVLEVLELLVLEVPELEVLEVLLLEVLELEVLEVLKLKVLELEALPQLLPVSPLPTPSPYPAQTGYLAERREPESRPASPVRTVIRARCPRPPLVPGKHTMALYPFSIPQRVALPSPPASFLPDVPDPESDLAHASSPTVTRFLAMLVTEPSFESAAATALVTELVDLAATCRLDYFASLDTESESDYPPSVGGELALGNDVHKDMHFELECLAAVSPHLASMLVCPKEDPDALDISTPRCSAKAITSEYSS
ncbi:unnamed protein product [Closterium sp. NIES-65]|nr:unnamed protein product [Closterium sp. NIES-65]